jgi:uncharacterized protein
MAPPNQENRVKTRAALAALSLSMMAVLGTVLQTTDGVPAIAAAGLLRPLRIPTAQPAPEGCSEAALEGEGIPLQGWMCRAVGARRGTVIYLHGVASNRSSAVGVIGHFRSRGYDVVAYDSRANGNSGGDVCTYGYWEKRDLHKVIDTLAPGPVVLMGASLGAAVALQEAADDPRVGAVVAAEVFADLRTVAQDRAPRVLTGRMIRRAFEIAEATGRFRVDEVSPERAAARIHVPVLLIHGAADTDTRPIHSERVLAALAGPKALMLVPGAGHNHSLANDAVWHRIDAWLDAALPAAR